MTYLVIGYPFVNEIPFHIQSIKCLLQFLFMVLE